MDLKKKLARLTVGPGVVRTSDPTTVHAEPGPSVNLSDLAGHPELGRNASSSTPLPQGSGGERDLGVDPRLEAIRARLRALEQRRPRNEVVRTGEVPFAEARTTEHGQLHVKTTRFGPQHRHGRVPLAHARTIDSRIAATLSLDPTFAELDFSRMVLLDTETTGLAGGTGTLPFLIGTARFDGPEFVVEQLFLRRPGEEVPMLRALGERLAEASCLVTYNGKTFDWPLLRNRFVMNRLPVPPPPPHLDLLHCARRVFRRRNGGGKLTHLEETVLGHARIGDVPGSEIPERYFAFIRRGHAAPLVPVLEHNVLDLVALAALFGELARQFDARGEEGDARDLLGFAETAVRATDFEAAAAFARTVATKATASLRAEALRMQAFLLRREGEVVAAVDALEAALRDAGRADRPAIHLALAKLYEHRLRKPRRALDHARQSATAEGPEAHRRRVARLEARLSTAAQLAR